MNKKIVIVDYSLGNLFSVQQAFLHLGINAVLSDNKKEIENADAIVIPGVGAFAEAMNALTTKDLIAPIKDFVSTGKPFLGICLGLQLLFEESEEFGSTKGLALIPGTIKKFNFSSSTKRVPIPQIAWNKIKKPANYTNKGEQTALKNVKENEFMYFVHSYYVAPTNKEDILCETEYEQFNYCSAIKKNNIFATQFHPEKSAFAGLKIYKNWIETI
jgi:glutamine amidotransferase